MTRLRRSAPAGGSNGPMKLPTAQSDVPSKASSAPSGLNASGLVQSGSVGSAGCGVSVVRSRTAPLPSELSTDATRRPSGLTGASYGHWPTICPARSASSSLVSAERRSIARPLVATSSSEPSGDSVTSHGVPERGVTAPRAGGPSGVTSHTRSSPCLADARQSLATADEPDVPGAALVPAQDERFLSRRHVDDADRVLVGAADGEPGTVGAPVEGPDVGQRDPPLERPRVDVPDLHLAIPLRSDRQQPARRSESELVATEAGRRDLIQLPAVIRRVDPDEPAVRERRTTFRPAGTPAGPRARPTRTRTARWRPSRPTS